MGTYLLRSLTIWSAACVALAACTDAPPANAPETQARAAAMVATSITEDTRIAAVLVRADWCPSCRIIEPALERVRAADPVAGVTHLTLDYTARDADALFAMADAAGIGPAVRSVFVNGKIRTGVVLLVDIERQAVVDDLQKSLSAPDMAARIRAATGA